MKYALVNAQNIVENIIVYDGEKPYRPAEGLTLRQVNDWVEIGLDADIAENAKPQPPVEDPAIERKRRMDTYKGNLALIASYKLEVEKNPALTFEEYVDSLEVMRDSIPA